MSIALHPQIYRKRNVMTLFLGRQVLERDRQILAGRWHYSPLLLVFDQLRAFFQYGIYRVATDPVGVLGEFLFVGKFVLKRFLRRGPFFV